MAGDIIQQGRDAINAVGNALSYTVGNCTRWVAEQASWIPAGLGNANQWLTNAQARGLPTAAANSVPPVGSVAVWGGGAFGHVAQVVSIIPGGFQVSEENWLGNGLTDIRNVTGSGLHNLQGFILPPGGVSGIPVVGGVVGAAQAVANVPDAIVKAGEDIAGIPTNIGHGIANAGQALTANAVTFVKNQFVPLLVALVVAIVLFGGDESKAPA